MYRLAVIIILLGLLPTAAHAAGGNMSFGYAYGRTDAGLGDSTNMNGWNGSLEGKVFPWVGVVADLTGQYGSQTCPGVTCPGSVDTSLHTFLFGPRVSVSVGNFRPFGEVLLGVGRAKLSATGFSDSDVSFATAVGGGIDYHWHGPLGWRVQGDMLRTDSFGHSQNNFRLVTGLVLSF